MTSLSEGMPLPISPSLIWKEVHTWRAQCQTSWMYADIFGSNKVPCHFSIRISEIPEAAWISAVPVASRTASPAAPL